MTLNCISRKRAKDMHDYKQLSSNTRACKEIRDSTDCSAFKYLSRIQFRPTTPTALSTSLLSHCRSLSAAAWPRPGLYTSTRQACPHSPSRPSLLRFAPLLTPLGLHWFSSSPSNVLCLFLWQSLWTSFLSACNALPPDLCMAQSFIPSKILSKCHLLSDACPCPRSPNRLWLGLFPSTALSTSHHTTQFPYLLFIVCLPLECKF